MAKKRLIDYDEVRELFDEEYKKTMQLIRDGETHLNNLAEGVTEADRVLWKLVFLKPLTNADRIRSMSDEELGIFLGEWAEKPWVWKRDGEGECLAWLKDPCPKECE